MLNNPEYTTKIDSYYYDQKFCTTMVVLKIRNKRAVYHLSIRELLYDKTALSSLHPLDLCIIGILASQSSVNKIKNNKSNPTPVLDDFLMVKMEPLLEIIRRDYIDTDEVITLKLKPLNRVMRTTATKLYNNKDLINALKYQDALSLGYSIGESPQVLQEKVIRSCNNYSMALCIKNGMFLNAFILSILLLSKTISLSIFGYQIDLKGEILLLPLLFVIQNTLLEKISFKNANQFLISSGLVLIIFLIYFSLVTNLPYPTNDPTSTAFNVLFHTITSKTPTYILSFLAANIINIYTLHFLSKRLGKLFIPARWVLITCFYISVFFIISAIFSLLSGQPTYSLINYFYSIILASFLSLTITFCKLRYSNKNLEEQ